MECGNKLSDQAKFCDGCGKPAENFNYKGINSNGESSISNEADLSSWVKIGRQYNVDHHTVLRTINKRKQLKIK